MARPSARGARRPRLILVFVLSLVAGAIFAFLRETARHVSWAHSVSESSIQKATQDSRGGTEQALRHAEQRTEEVTSMRQKIAELQSQNDRLLGEVKRLESNSQALPWKRSLPEDPNSVTLDQGVLDALARVEFKGEVMVALANDVMMCTNPKTCWWKGGNILETWISVVQRLQIQNYLILALDNAVYQFCQEKKANCVRTDLPVPKVLEATHPANRISTLKYGVLDQMLVHNYSVLISDLDLVLTTNPFPHLHRDSDIEVQTDGFTRENSHGHLKGIKDPSMGWGGGGLYVEVFTLNVGFGFIRPTYSSIMLMRRVRDRLMDKPAWDQQVFNEEVWLPASPDHNHAALGVAVRVMDCMKFTNSKIYFKSSRSRFLPGRSAKGATPLMIHMNYHPDKHKRMLCLVARYFDGRIGACDQMPGGSEPGT
mmetsp:Transcript_13446/g.48913  ORF Transcript_13446/g.48913 Transcript_13446/m.48913 type:complete len:427 (-) Transcript_13446:2589-3869(-)